MLKNTLVKNSLFSSLSWGGNVILNLFLIPVIIHYIGSEGFGIYALMTGLIGYFSLLDLGFGQGIIKFVAEYEEKKESANACSAINSALFVQCTTGGLGFLLLIIFNNPILDLLHVSPQFYHEASVCLYLSAGGFFISMFMATFSSALIGLQAYPTVGKVNLSVSLVTTLSSLCTLALGGGLYLLILITVISTLLQMLVFFHFVRSMILDYSILYGYNKHMIVKLWKYSGYLFVFKLSGLLNNYFVRFIVALLWGPQAVTAFVVPYKLISLAQGFMSSFSGVFFPFASALSARGDDELLRTIYIKSSKYVSVLSTPIFIFLGFYSWSILKVWMGDEFADTTWPVLAFLAPAHLLAAWTMIPANTALGLGQSKVVALFSTIVAILNLAFVFILTGWYGAVGAAAAIFISSLQGPIFIWYVTVHVLFIEWSQYWQKVFRMQIIPVFVFIISIIGLLICAKHFPLINIPIITLILGILCSVIFIIYLIRSKIIILSEFKNKIYSSEPSPV